MVNTSAAVEGLQPGSGYEQSRTASPEPPLSPWDRKFLLSLDGGGVRGLSTLYILADLMTKISAIEQRMDVNATHSFHPDPFLLPKGPNHAEEEGDPVSRYLPCHYFDLISGISTGGLIAIMLGRLRMSVRDCIQEYTDLSKQVFQTPNKLHMKQKHTLLRNPFKDKYDSKPLHDAIEKVVQDRNLFDGSQMVRIPSQLCQNVIFAVEGRSNLSQFPFVSHDRSRRDAYHIPVTSTFRITDVALAATAAPGYFRPHDVDKRRFFDCGILTVNPCSFSLTELEALYARRTDINRGSLAGILSLGTGRLPVRPKELSEWRESFRFRHKYVYDFLKKQASDPSATHQNVRAFVNDKNDSLARSGCEFRIHYARITVTLDGEDRSDRKLDLPDDVVKTIEEKMVGMKLDGWSKTMQSDIELATKAFLRTRKIQDRLSAFANALVTLRRERSKLLTENDDGARWYRYASASEWSCDLCNKMLLSYRAIHQHMADHHPGCSVERDATRDPCSHTTERS